MTAARSAGKPRRIALTAPPSGARLAAGLPIAAQAYQPDDAEEYFQTWNAYLQSTDGHHVFANFAVSNLGIGDHTCGMNLAITLPGGRTLLETFQRDGDHFRGRTDKISVRCDDTVMLGDADTLTWRGTEKTLALEVKVTRGPPGAGTGRIWLDDERSLWARYNVPHLGSRFEGRIRYEGAWHRIEGVAAVEHFAGNTSLHRFSTLWHRVRVMSGGVAMLAGGFEPAPGYESGVYYLFLARDGRLVHVSDTARIRTTRRVRHEASGYLVPARVEIAVDDARLRLRATATRQRLVGEFDVLQQLNPVFRAFIRVFFANPWIFRNDAAVDLAWSLDGEPEQKLHAAGMHEVIYVNEE